MQLHPFGKTGMHTTPLGLGLAALGRPGYINLGHGDDLAGKRAADALEAHTHTVLDTAWAAGIRYFDAARSYGKAEAFLASWLNQKQFSPIEVMIGSKWGYTYTADWQVSLPDGEPHEVKEHSLAVLTRQMRESRSLLGGQLDLYQVHSATLSSGILENTAVLTHLAQLKADGLLIGLSVSGPNQAETIWRALEVQVDGQPLFQSVQATWNLLERAAGEALQAAADAGWGVIIKEAVANGRLTPRNQEPDFVSQMALLTRIATQQQTTVDALALAAAIHQPFSHVVLSGAANGDQLTANLGALTFAWSPSIMEAFDSLREPADQYWQTRSNLAWN